MLSKLLRTQVPDTYKRAHPTGAEQLMDRLKSAFTKNGAKQFVADYRKGCELLAEEQVASGRQPNQQHERNKGAQPGRRGGRHQRIGESEIDDYIEIDRPFLGDD